ncbi:CorA family divalent cation transporter [Methylocystis heyeri]|uniref:Magnesium transporter CorA n=1 Tax=Methylocystis heyeri TaxID=391905 RepID=A0A6B8KAN9_9HYPH|nr:CorA family divalent cation transporter [Methylocystis heyeri]QGM44542.1 magnesium transporter CorA [Methylocystis heyeri]
MDFDHYGKQASPVPGCAWMLRFDEEGRAEPGEEQDLAKLGAPGEGFVWLHVDLNDSRSSGLLARLAALPEEVRKILSEPVDRQFIDHSGDIVRGAFFDRERGAPGGPPQIGFLRFAFGERFLASASHRPIDAAEATKAALTHGRLASTPLELFEAMVGHICDELGKIIYELSSTLDGIEERIVADGKGESERATLGSVRRAALRLAREAAGLRSPLLRLEATLYDPELEELKEAGARLARRADILVHDLAEVQDRARLLQDELNAIASLVTNDRLYILTMVTTLLLPATFVTGFFGMNTKALPFAEAAHGTAYAAALCVTASLVTLFFMRRIGLTRPRAEPRQKRPRQG